MIESNRIPATIKLGARSARALGFLSAWLLSGVAPAAADQGQLTTPERLLLWASKTSERAMPADGLGPPLIPMSPNQLARMVCPDKPLRCRTLAAAYSFQSSSIYYRDSFTIESTLERSFIVHEMVHFLQHLALGDRANQTCNQVYNLEREAYEVQSLYLRQQGSPYVRRAMPRSFTCLSDTALDVSGQ